MRHFLLLITITAIVLCECHAGAQGYERGRASSSSLSNERVINIEEGQRVIQEVHRGLSTTCRVDGKEFPPSYLVSDLGKPTVPHLTTRELHDVQLISHYVRSATLRFQTVNHAFMVYDASLGPCMASAPGYWVLNAKSCNMNFMPVDEWLGPAAFYRCIHARRPWMPRDGGDPNIKWGQFSPSGISTPNP